MPLSPNSTSTAVLSEQAMSDGRSDHDNHRQHQPRNGAQPSLRSDGERLIAAVTDAIADDERAGDAYRQDGGSDLVRLLATVPVIEQAKGLLIGHFGINSTAAYDVLVRWSSATNTKLSQLCERLLTAAAQPGDTPAAHLRGLIESLGRQAGGR
jgi:hypothetical protein